MPHLRFFLQHGRSKVSGFLNAGGTRRDQRPSRVSSRLSYKCSSRDCQAAPEHSHSAASTGRSPCRCQRINRRARRSVRRVPQPGMAGQPQCLQQRPEQRLRQHAHQRHVRDRRRSEWIGRATGFMTRREERPGYLLARETIRPDRGRYLGRTGRGWRIVITSDE
jgi:hypothetical protein